MKLTAVVSLALVFAQAAALSGHGGLSSDVLSAKSPAPAAAVAAAPGPSASPAPTLPGLKLSFEVENFNYYDLHDQNVPPGQTPQATKPADEATKTAESKSDKAPEAAEKAEDEVLQDADEVAQDVDDAAQDVEGQMEDLGDVMVGKGFVQTAASISEKPHVAEESPFDKKPPTYAESFKKATESVVSDEIVEFSHAPAPATMMPPAPAMVDTAPAALVPLPPQAPPTAFLQSHVTQPAAGAVVIGGPAAGPAAGPAPAPVAAVAKIHVGFQPGREMKKGVKTVTTLLQQVPQVPKTTLVEVLLTDRPFNGIDDLAAAAAPLHAAIRSGVLVQDLEKAFTDITYGRVQLQIGSIKLEPTQIVPWDVEKCERHIRDIVGAFSKHYTREQVPMALYNECTNFMTKISFSSDFVLDPADTKACRKTTANFAKRWNFGKNADGKDFEAMCIHACEKKFGSDAPSCHIHAGDELHGAPM